MAPSEEQFNQDRFNYSFNPGDFEEFTTEPLEERRRRGAAAAPIEEPSQFAMGSEPYSSEPMSGYGDNPQSSFGYGFPSQPVGQNGALGHSDSYQSAPDYSLPPLPTTRDLAPGYHHGAGAGLGGGSARGVQHSHQANDLDGFSSTGYVANSGALVPLPATTPAPSTVEAPRIPTSNGNYYTATGKLYAKAVRIGDGKVLSQGDQTIVDMKAEGKSNKEIIKKLEEFGIFYHEKTIGTRHGRIIQRLQEKQEEILEKGDASWTREEDQALLLSYNAANIALKERADRANAKKYTMVSKYLKSHLGKDASYGASACQKRINELKKMLVDTGDVKELSDNEDVATSMDIGTKELPPAEAKARLESEICADKLKLAKKQEMLQRLCELEEHLVVPEGIQPGSSTKGLLDSDGAPKRPDQISALRLHMLLRELEDMCWNRKLPKAGTKTELVRRLAVDDAKKTEADLRKALSDAKLPTYGFRRQLLHRIVAFEVNASLLKRGIGQKHHDFVPQELPSPDASPANLTDPPPAPRKPALRAPKRDPLEYTTSLESPPPKRRRRGQEKSGGLVDSELVHAMSDEQRLYNAHFGERSNRGVTPVGSPAQNTCETPPSYEQALKESMREQFADFGRGSEDD